MLAQLERVRRFAMPNGAVPCREIRLRQVAEIRLAPDGAWLAHEAEQRIDPLGVAFRWKARTRMARLFPITIVDAFEGGQGELTVRLFGVIPLVRGRGAEFDRGEAMRGLAEMPWHPFGFNEHPGLTWAAAEGGGLHAAFDDGRTRAAVDFQLDDKGRVLGARAANRPRWVGKTVVGRLQRVQGVRWRARTDARRSRMGSARRTVQLLARRSGELPHHSVDRAGASRLLCSHCYLRTDVSDHAVNVLTMSNNLNHNSPIRGTWSLRFYPPLRS
jgi:hypothetical protein